MPDAEIGVHMIVAVESQTHMTCKMACEGKDGSPCQPYLDLDFLYENELEADSNYSPSNIYQDNIS